MLSAGLEKLFERYDAIVTPAAPGEAPVGEATGDPAFCTLWTYCGVPAVTLPLLTGSNGMPVGVQLVGRRLYDGRLLRTADWLTQRLQRRGPERRRGDGRRGMKLLDRVFATLSLSRLRRLPRASSSGLCRSRASFWSASSAPASAPTTSCAAPISGAGVSGITAARPGSNLHCRSGDARLATVFKDRQSTWLEKIRWGVISTALIGTKKVIPGMQRSKRGTVDAIASRDLSRAKAAAAKLGIPKAYGSYEAAARRSRTSTRSTIPLPNNLHIDWTIEALKAGKHVLCEKPFGMNAKDAARVLQAVAGKRHVMEAFMVRFHPQWLRARELSASGKIGELKAVQVFFAYDNRDPKNIRNMAGDRRRRGARHRLLRHRLRPLHLRGGAEAHRVARRPRSRLSAPTG